MNRNVILSLMALVFVSANAQDVVPAQNDNKAITLGSEYRDWHGDIDYINMSNQLMFDSIIQSI